MRTFIRISIIVFLTVLAATLGFMAVFVAGPTVGRVFGSIGLGFGALVAVFAAIAFIIRWADQRAEMVRIAERLDDLEALLNPPAGGAAPANATDLEAERRRLVRRAAQLTGQFNITAAAVAVVVQGGTRTVTRPHGWTP